MSSTPFQVYLINKFIEQIMNKKFEKNAHHSTRIFKNYSSYLGSIVGQWISIVKHMSSAQQSTPVHARARQCTPEHGSARQSTQVHANARQCTPEHVSARQCTPIHTKARQCTPEHARARQCNDLCEDLAYCLQYRAIYYAVSQGQSTTPYLKVAVLRSTLMAFSIAPSHLLPMQLHPGLRHTLQ